MRSAARQAHGRQRVRDLRSDLQTVTGGLTLATAVLLCYAALIALALGLGVAQTWPLLAWVGLGALAVLILSLFVLFLRDLRRWRQAMTAASRG